VQALLPYLHQHNIPVIGGDNTTATWTSDSLLFPLGTTLGEVVAGDYRTAHQRGLTKLGLVYCVEAPACTFVHEYTNNGGATRAGEELIYQGQVSITQPDYTAQCLGAQSAGAQVIFLALDGNSMERFAASCSRQNYHPVYLATAYQSTIDMEGNKDLEGMLAAAQEFPGW
ncbi:MAG: ABC transporter substrate-binding protein, partial [Candidatus Dormibacteria bacterium]